MDIVNAAYAAIAGFAPANPMQECVWRTMHDAEWGIHLLLKAPTGSGKTEAIAVPTLAAGNRRLIMVYPARSLVDDQTARFKKMIANASHLQNRAMTLVIDTGAESMRLGWRNGEPIVLGSNPRRHLYHGDVIITTLDKLLYRFFGFGEPGKSYIYPLRIQHGAQKTLFCFDEAHSYGDVSFTNFNRLIKTFNKKAIDVALMTATMPEAFVAEFGYLDVIDFVDNIDNHNSLEQFNLLHYPKRCHPNKKLKYIASDITLPQSATQADADDGDPLKLDFDTAQPQFLTSDAINLIIKLAREHRNPDRRLIVTVESVRDAANVFLSLRSDDINHLLLYHGRLTSKQRRKVYQKLLDLEQQGAGYTLVSTSAIEVGCDLNAHMLITQLPEPDRLIQRAGRCNRRHEMPKAEVIVVGNTIPEWLTDMTPDQISKYVTVLSAHNGDMLNPAAILTCLSKSPQFDERIELLFDMLYEYVYAARLEYKPLHNRGLVITRSWEPSLTLCTSYDEHGDAQNAVEVPMTRCIARAHQPRTSSCFVLKESFDPLEYKPSIMPLRQFECAYSVDLVVVCHSVSFDEELGYVELPKLFYSYGMSDKQRRILEGEAEGNAYKLWYVDPKGMRLVASMTRGNQADNADDHGSTQEELSDASDEDLDE